MKAYKAIFRLDYRLSYSILDRLGEQLEFLQERTSGEPYREVKGQVDLIGHAINNKGMIRDDKYGLVLALDTFNADIEFSGGYDINQLARYPLFTLADEVIERSELSKVKEFNRIGFRVWILDQGPSLVFNKIRNHIVNLNATFTSVLAPHFSSLDDIALVVEGSDKNGDKIRNTVGPYQKEEQKKYFALSPEVEEGLIMDIDLWQNKISIPGFKLVSFIKYCQEIFNHVGQGTVKKLLEALE